MYFYVVVSSSYEPCFVKLVHIDNMTKPISSKQTTVTIRRNQTITTDVDTKWQYESNSKSFCDRFRLYLFRDDVKGIERRQTNDTSSILIFLSWAYALQPKIHKQNFFNFQWTASYLNEEKGKCQINGSHLARVKTKQL